VSAPPDLVETLMSLLQLRDVPDVFRGDTFVELLGDQVDQVIGPNWYGYVSRGGYRAGATRGCREIAVDDDHLIDLLREGCGVRDWAQASFDKAPALLRYFDFHNLVAASNLTDWRTGDDRIGVVTHPEFRGRGYGAGTLFSGVHHPEHVVV